MRPKGPGAAPEPRNGAGRFALQLGVVAVVAAMIPFIGEFIATPTALASLVLGTVGYLRAAKGAATNPGQAVAGAVLGLAAGFIVFTMNVITSAGP